MNSQRPRRLRKNSWVRNAIAETSLRREQLVYPIFVSDQPSEKKPIQSLPGQFRWGSDHLAEILDLVASKQIGAVALFPSVNEKCKDNTGRFALEGLVPETLSRIKKEWPDLQLISDVALDPYSSEGHDGIVRDGQILNDETVEVLAKMAVVHSESGADWVAPSDMMDGRVGKIREALDEKGLVDTGIIAYTAKYASCFYGPFREALDSAPKFGDKKTYQMDFRNIREAIREWSLDQEEGADFAMVKPAMPYLDVIRELAQVSDIPIAAYQVSGEYAMLAAAGERGWLDKNSAVLESLTAISRAGASLIFSYYAVEVAEMLR